MQTITPFLWFDHDLQQVIDYYTNIFDDVKTNNVSRMPNGQVMTASFDINGQKFMALKGGPLYKFNEAVSFFVSVETQEEVDELWDKLTAAGGQEGNCGWLKDKFGVSWQIIPTALGELLGDPDREKANRAMQAMIQMNKLDIAKLKAAYTG